MLIFKLLEPGEYRPRVHSDWSQVLTWNSEFDQWIAFDFVQVQEPTNISTISASDVEDR